jgi:hypothetical protein
MEAANLTSIEFDTDALQSAHVQGANLTGVDLRKAGLSPRDVVAESDGGVTGVRVLPERLNPRVWTLLWYYRQYLAAARLELAGVPRGYEYLIAVMAGGLSAAVGDWLHVVNPVLSFWVVFVGVLSFYKYVLPRDIRRRHEALLRLVESLRESRDWSGLP